MEVLPDPRRPPLEQEEIPDGYKLKGTSTLYDDQGNLRARWVKTDENRERQLEILREMVAGFAEKIPRDKPRAVPKGAGTASADLLAVLPVGDHHLGMYAWNEDAGGDYDLDEGERLLNEATRSLVGSLPAAPRAMIAMLGDFLHYDSLAPVTPAAKNLLDSDGRYAKMVRVAIRCARKTVATALDRFGELHVIVQAGNHDPATSIFLAECMAALYENEPRVTIDTSPRQFHYYEHGKVLMGVCHGHEVGRKIDKLPLIMAADRPEAWGRTKHRYWLTGHIHHDRVADVEGVRVESFRVLPPSDAWADSKGYRSAREMKALLMHAEHGEVQRVSVNPGMFE